MKILFSLCLFFLVFCFSLQTYALNAWGFFLKNTPNAKMQFSEGIQVHTIEKNVEFPISHHNAQLVPNTDKLIDTLIEAMLGKEKIGTLELQKKNKTGSIGGNISILGTHLRWYRDISEEENMDDTQEHAENEDSPLYYNSQTRVYTTFSVETPGEYRVKIYPHDVKKLKLLGKPNLPWRNSSILLLDPVAGIHIHQASFRTTIPTVSVWWKDDVKKVNVTINTENMMRKYDIVPHVYNNSWLFISPDEDIKIVMPYDEMILDIPYAGEYTLSFVYQYMNSQDDNGVFQQFFQE